MYICRWECLNGSGVWLVGGCSCGWWVSVVVVGVVVGGRGCFVTVLEIRLFVWWLCEGVARSLCVKVHMCVCVCVGIIIYVLLSIFTYKI